MNAVSTPTLRGEEDWVCPPTARDDAAVETLLRHGWGAEYLDVESWRVVSPEDSVFGGTTMSSRRMRALADALAVCETW